MAHDHGHMEGRQQSNASINGYARDAREKKRDAAIGIGVTSGYISAFVDRFYARIRKDDMLGPIFESRIRDWPAHLDRMKAFWRSVLHNAGEFSGNPMLKHILIPGIGAAHFDRWLQLFYETLRELEPSPDATTLVGTRARLIADSLLTGIEIQRDGVRGGRAGDGLPHI